jgi:ribose transport system permease protein
MKNATHIIHWLSRQPWLWAFLGNVTILFFLLATKGTGTVVAILPVALSFASLYVLVGIGQMFVIANGPGNIDLSIPMVMTLCAYLATGQMHGPEGGFILGTVLGVSVGMAIGFTNALFIRKFDMPPMIVTLAVGMVAQSITLAYSKVVGVVKPAPELQYLATGKILGVPIFPAVLAIISIGLVFVIKRSIFARSVFSIGQNPRAAYLAGVKVNRTQIYTYVLSGGCAGIAGVIVAGFQGGASLGMATDYLLISIAVVVLGGTPITGGRATIVGTWSASIFFFLILSLLNSFQVQIGLRNIITGLMILLVLILGSVVTREPSRKT